VYLAIVVVAPDPHIVDSRLDAQTLVDVLWALAQPADRIEHISAATSDREARIGLYVQADSQATAERRALALLERATATAHLLRGWCIPPPPPSGDPADGQGSPL
jgi:hypothetical protein